VTILGIWDGHDAGAALLIDGRVAAAVNEERLSRRKLEVRFPEASIRACLEIGRVAPADVSLVAASTTDPAKTLGRLMPWTKERYYAVRRRRVRPGRLASMTWTAKRRITEWPPNALTTALSGRLVRRRLAPLGVAAPLRMFDHHQCHAWSAACCSGFDACAVVTIDGLGDGVSATIGEFRGGALSLRVASPARDSLGVFFEHVTHLLNMRELEDEGKVMALADHVAPVPDEQNPLLALFSVQDGRVRCASPAHALAPRLRAIQWSRPNEQFAFLAQRTVERIAVRLVEDAVRLTGQRRVALAGGVASNVKANRLIRLVPDVESVYVFPHMGDGGLALGAALAASASTGGATRVALDSLALGPCFSAEAIQDAARAAGVTLHAPVDLAVDVADRLAADQIVCWFQGRMEYGPRALGQRSVLARPDRLEIKDRLNLVMKRRVWYQPFCPSVLETEAPRLFADWTNDAARCRHMTMAFSVKREFRAALAGAASADGSCRPQLVRDDSGEPLAPVLREIRARLGVGAVINTSFNIHGEPLVCSPAEAFSVFLRSGADALAIDRWVAVKAPGLGAEAHA
jgi:carbamoyltransferase